jgi:hypothetical protein
VELAIQSSSPQLQLQFFTPVNTSEGTDGNEFDEEDSKQMIMVASWTCVPNLKNKGKQVHLRADESTNSNNISLLSFHSNYIMFLGDIV